MQVIVDGLVTHYTDKGSGKVIVFLHGWGDSLSTFKGLETKLSQNYRTVSVDLPGFGKTEKPKGAYTLSKYAMFVKNFLAKIDVADVHVIIGHSNGAAVAVKLLSERLIDADKLVILAGAGVRSEARTKKKAIRLAAKTAKIPTKLLPKKTQMKLKKRAYSALGSDLFVAEDMQETFKNVIGEDVVAASANITAETLLIYGSEDAAAPPRYGELFASSIPNSRLEIIEGAEHFLHQSHEDTVYEMIREVL